MLNLGAAQLYRVYLLDDGDRIKSFIELQAVSDADAIEQANQYGRLHRRAVEVWRGKEMIYRDPAAKP